MLLDRRAARREKQVDLRERALEQAAVAPELRRPVEGERAAETLGLLAELTILLPEVVHRAHEPVVVGRVELERVAAEVENAGAEQRHQMEVDDVEPLAREDPPQLGQFQPGPAGQIRHERRERPGTALQAMHGHVLVLRELTSWRRLRQRPERIDAVDDRDPMATLRQLVREPIDVHRLAAEVVRRVEGRDHAERERTVRHRKSTHRSRAASWINVRSSTAAASQLRPETASRERVATSLATTRRRQGNGESWRAPPRLSAGRRAPRRRASPDVAAGR